MKKRLSAFLLTALILASTALHAQYYDIGQAPARTRWMKIDTGNFSIIYPDYFYEKARQTAALFSSQTEAVASGLHTFPRKTPIILHPGSAISNAFAIWAPRRIEIYTTPPQDTYAQPWLHQLTLHEYRHIVQLSKLDQGITRFFGYLFGQQAAAISTGLFVPSWFIEGDAVATETGLGKSGRGRMPSFNAPLRALLAEKERYSYPKASFGSYRDFVPDIYTTGYHIVAASRTLYGQTSWNEAMNSVARKPWLITPFNHGLKSASGLNKKGLYLQSMAYLDSLWQGRQLTDEAIRIIPEKTRSHTNYHSPHQMNDSTFISLKTTLHDIPRIVKTYSSGREEIIHTPGFIFDNRISYSNGTLVWSEYRPHVRWSTVSYTDLVYLNTQTGELKRKSFRKRFFAPAISPDGKKTAVSETDGTGKHYITIIQSDTINRYIVPEGVFPSFPSWSGDMRKIAFIGTSESGKALYMLDPDEKTFSVLLPYAFSEISEPYFLDKGILFSASVNAKSQICLLDLTSGEASVLTSSAYGGFAPSFSDNRLTYLEYSADGTRIANRSINKPASQPYTPDTDQSWPLAAALAGQENSDGVTFAMPDTDYPQKRYKKAAHLFGVHSWAPLYIDIGGETARPGFSVMSQNLLSTMFITAGYDYNPSEETGMFRASLAWKAWFPEFRVTTSHGLRASSFTGDDNMTRRFTWNETNLDLSISQALNLSRGNVNSGIYGEITHNFSQVRHLSGTPERFMKGIFSGMSYRVFGYSYQRQAYRDLAPDFGINIDVSFRHTPAGEINAGSVFGIQSQLFLPGIAANHSLSVYGAYQQTDPGDYRYANLISISRGYTTIPFGEELISWKAAYRLPLFYPDFHLGGLLYIKRLRANAFYDFTDVKARETQNSGYFNSAGLDLISDVHLFGLSTPVSAGIRGVYTFRDGTPAFGFLFSVNFYEY
ncbi:hypothetical protein [Lentimicrobium sp.]|uniref:hypothetical protein n=1 Tax=Lentimicrobium sp. TaxID=2034841 RepID=UPI0025FAEF90|nr:hypothetical protein [Lentimicrobium sp.]MCO5255555.1 hypothetical protein [Lentimicrobium sp.]MCO5262880.1 hypothetical protein [Lentimicrobium sp.]HPR26648.1 hypothetical protein [Lentimicrobium sp.]